MSSLELKPTYVGCVATTQDALILFEACLNGTLNHAARRPHDRERPSLIKSGHIFIYEEHSSGIKRWTDGISWSPSRILGNYLVYRQLPTDLPAGVKKKSLKKKTSPNGVQKNTSVVRRNSHASFSDNSAEYVGSTKYSMNGIMTPEHERALIGSLTDSYDFKEDGLVKKTISITNNEITHHLVSYYNIEEAAFGNLMRPSADPRFENMRVRDDLRKNQNFRGPVDEVDPFDRSGGPTSGASQYNLGMRPHYPTMGGLPMSSLGLAGSSLSGVPIGTSIGAPMMPLSLQSNPQHMAGFYGQPVSAGSNSSPLSHQCVEEIPHGFGRNYGTDYPQLSHPIHGNGDVLRHPYGGGGVSGGFDGNRAPMPHYEDQRERKYTPHSSMDSGVSGLSASALPMPDPSFHSSHQDHKTGSLAYQYPVHSMVHQNHGQLGYSAPSAHHEPSRSHYNSSNPVSSDLRSLQGSRGSMTNAWPSANGNPPSEIPVGLSNGINGSEHGHTSHSYPSHNFAL